MVGLKIKRYLDSHGVKYSFIANKLGLNINTLSLMLCGKRKITIEEYFAICLVLNVDTNKFRD